MFHSLIRLVVLSCLCLTTSLHAAGKAFEIKCDHPSGVYALGETAKWEIAAAAKDGIATAFYTVKKDGLIEVTKGKLDLSSGPVTISATREEPGALLLEIFADEKPYVPPIAVAGAVFAPEKIGPAAPAPQDFTEFWDSKLKELAAVPIEPVEEAGTSPDPVLIDYTKVTLNNIRGTKVRAQLLRPVKEKKYPALLVFQSAGTGALDTKTAAQIAKIGWLVLNVSAHDLPIDETDAYYKEVLEKWKTEYKSPHYIYIGNEDRESSYFLRMLLGCVRAAEYITTRPDWDGQTLVATGISQGGLQSIATAALSPYISCVMTGVPAGCDVYAPLATPPRAFGWPYWLSKWGPADRDQAKIQKTAGYFDPINFAARIKCPTLIGVGLGDNASRPAGVIAAYNAITAPKELVIMPLANHHGSEGTQLSYFNRLNAWRTAILNKQTIPVAAPEDK